MSEEIEEIDDNININKSKENENNTKITKRKRRVLINNDSDDEEKKEENEQLQINNKEETEEENVELRKNIRNTKDSNNRFNTLDKNNIEKSPVKDNLALQEKLKKIFMNRDKLKFQYTKQDIPDNLKYHSDDSDSSDISGLRKSKISKKNEELFKNKNENIKENEIKTTIKKSNKNSNKKNNNELNKTENINFENKNSNKNSDKKENVKNLKKCLNNESEKKRKFNSYNVKNNDIDYNDNVNDEKEKIKSNNNEKRRFIKDNNIDSNEDKEEKNEEENNLKSEEKNKKENVKKSKLPELSAQKDENDNEEKGEINNEDDNEEINNDSNNNTINKKKKLLKLLIEKKNNGSTEKKVENDKINYNDDYENKNKNKNDLENEDKEEDKEDTLKMKYDPEKEKKKRRIMKQIKSDSENSTINKNNKNLEIGNENPNEKEKVENKEENYENNNNDKGTYIFNSQRDKLTINIKPKNNWQNQILSTKDDNHQEEVDIEKEDESEQKEESQKNKKANALKNVIEIIKQKKSSETKDKNLQKNEKIVDYNYKNEKINEIEIEKEAEKIRKKEKRIEERKKLKEKKDSLLNEEIINNNLNQNNEKENNNINNNYLYSNKRRISSKEIKHKEIKNEEVKRRKKLEEDLKAEINKKESFGDNKEDEISTVNNTSKSNLINNSQFTQNENEEKNNRKELGYKPMPIRNTSNIGNRYKNMIEESNMPTEIAVNDIPLPNLDRSFDAANAYMKRKIPRSKRSINIYKPKKVNNNNIRYNSLERNLNELVENDSRSFNPNNNPIYNNYNNYCNPNPNIYRNKNSLGNNFIKNNNSFRDLPIDNSTPQSIGERNNVNMETDFGGGLNSSYDAYLQANINTNFNNNINGNIFNTKKPIFFGNDSKKYNTSGYHKKNNIPNRNTSGSKNFYKNENINKSYGYINTGFNNNNIFDNNNIANINNNYNRNIINQNESNYFYGKKNQQFITYNNNNQNPLLSYSNNIPLKTYGNQNMVSNFSNENYENNIFKNPNNNPKRFSSSKIKNTINNINNPTNINNNNFIYNNININNAPYQPYQTPNQNENQSINIEDLLVLEEKFKEIIIGLNKNKAMHNECFEFWNYYFNCSLYSRLEKLFKSQSDSLNVQISINHILISVMICYDFSFEIDILNGEYSILEDILDLNHKNLIVIYEHILSKVSAESKSNIWVLKLNNLINNFNNINDINSYYSIKGRQMSSVDKIVYNTTVIIQNIRVLLKNYKTKRIEYLTSIFKKINEKTYEEINIFFRDNILRVDNISGSVLASVFLKDNEYFQTEPAPYIKTKNRKPYSLILDLDETLVHFKINNEDENEGVLQIRPGVVPFLEQVGKYYELIVFTAATQDYGDLLIDAIEENNLYFEHRFYRQHTVIIGNDFVKDLNRIGRPIDKMIIVDNMPQNFRLQKENGINIKAFWGEDADDNALEELGIILTNIAKEGGDLRIGLERYKDEIVRKVTSNISKSNY